MIVQVGIMASGVHYELILLWSVSQFNYNTRSPVIAIGLIKLINPTSGMPHSVCILGILFEKDLTDS